ncbi:hypothetical protein B0H17DRAFT_1205296 [Mycena rosella]|uniref:C2H2-type domain-containing protein n=1 Tax=Mycena rosella TaxID=1033263 RepID=A0AAD7D7W6_MYCRO|nr:hypothetical protein B0H17DRAFT_1205296 [Mycena rosella]
MSSSSDSGRGRRSHDRPMLPPIRDLFRELSSSRAPPESPALTLARLRLSDEEDRPRHAYASSSSHGPNSRPTSTRPPSRSHPDPATFVHPQQPRFNTMPAAVYDRPRSSTDPHAPRGPYPPPQYQNVPPRSMSYDPAGYPVDRNAYDPRYDSRGPRPPYNATMGHPPSQQIPPYYARVQPPSAVMPPAISTSIRASRGEDADRTPIALYQSSGMAGFAPPDVSMSIGGPTKYECSYCGKGFSRPSSLRIHLNSHTGEKPFVCPVDGCGRSFSVLSNMRRHARVHVTPLMSGDGGGERALSLASSSQTSPSIKWKHHRRDSSASASSSGSRRSRSVSSEDEEEDIYDHPEKRTRHHHRK